jgi:hypothetical protein
MPRIYIYEDWVEYEKVFLVQEAKRLAVQVVP